MSRAVVCKMSKTDILNNFFRAIAQDPVIGASHISIYCALHQLCDDEGAAYFTSAEVMKLAKVSGLGTYHKCIRDLHQQGYICYRPSYNHRKKSRVLFKLKSVER